MTSRSQSSLNERLRRRRRDFGASIKQVARWAQVDPDRLTAIEGGAVIPWWELDRICRALAVDSGAFARGDDSNPRRSIARFKAADWSRPTPEDLRTLSLAAELGRIGGFLAKGTEQPVRLAELRSPVPIDDRTEPWRQGYHLGANARLKLRPASGPIHDLEGSFIDWGIHVGRVEFSSADLDAASLWEQDSLPVILLNVRSIRTRSSLSRRALLAHELCHLLHDSGEYDLLTQLSWGEGMANYSEEVEQRARAFAPAFLAPRDEVRHWDWAAEGKWIHDPETKVRRLAQRWGFSLRGAIWHAKNCEIIAASTAEKLDREMPVHQEHEWSADFEQHGGKTGLGPRHSATQGPVDITDGLLSQLVAVAATANLISEGRAREILTWR